MIAPARSDAKRARPGSPWRAGSATTRRFRWRTSRRSTRSASIRARSKPISPTTPSLRCSPGRKKWPPPRSAWRRPTRRPTGASSSCTASADRRTRTWSRSASRSRCNGTSRNRQDREVAAKLAMVDQARAERDDMLRAHVAEVRAMIAEWENDRERSARYAREVLPLATERIAGRRSPPIAAAKQASPTCCWRAATRSMCACRRCNSRWTRRACGRSSTSWFPRATR